MPTAEGRGAKEDDQKKHGPLSTDTLPSGSVALALGQEHLLDVKLIKKPINGMRLAANSV